MDASKITVASNIEWLYPTSGAVVLCV